MSTESAKTNNKQGKWKDIMSKNIAQFCDESGNTILGSDSMIWIDGRWNLDSRDRAASEKRDRFRKNFPEKFDSMTHYIYNGVIHRVW